MVVGEEWGSHSRKLKKMLIGFSSATITKVEMHLQTTGYSWIHYMNQTRHQQ